MNPADRLTPAGFGLTERAVKAAVSGALEQRLVERMVAEAMQRTSTAPSTWGRCR